MDGNYILDILSMQYILLLWNKKDYEALNQHFEIDKCGNWLVLSWTFPLFFTIIKSAQKLLFFSFFDKSGLICLVNHLRFQKQQSFNMYYMIDPKF